MKTLTEKLFPILHLTPAVPAHRMLSPEGFPVTSLSHNHLTSITGLLLFIYLVLAGEQRGGDAESPESAENMSNCGD